MVRVLASCSCGPSLIPKPGITCRLSFLLVLILCQWVILQVFGSPPSTKSNIPNSNSTWKLCTRRATLRNVHGQLPIFVIIIVITLTYYNYKIMDAYFRHTFYLVTNFLVYHYLFLFSIKELYGKVQQHLKISDWYVWVHMDKGQITMPIFQSLDAYWPGLQVGDSCH